MSSELIQCLDFKLLYKYLSTMKLSKAFLVATSSIELLLFPFTGPLFIFILYLIASLSFIYSISKNKFIFVLLSCLPMFFVFVTQVAMDNEKSRLLITTLCIYVPWAIAVILACLISGNFPNIEARLYGSIEKMAIYTLSIIPFLVAILFICMLP